MNSTLLLLKGKISDVNLIELKGRLDRMESVGHYNLDLTPVLSTLKSPGIGLVLGFLFGWLGVDRFYKGDMWLGIFKILLCTLPVFLVMGPAQNGNDDLAGFASLIMCVGIVWCIADRFYKGDAWLDIFKILLCILPVFLVMGAAQNSNDDLAALASLIMCAGIIWCIADLFLVYMGIKKDNFKKIMASL